MSTKGGLEGGWLCGEAGESSLGPGLLEKEGSSGGSGRVVVIEGDGAEGVSVLSSGLHFIYIFITIG